MAITVAKYLSLHYPMYASVVAIIGKVLEPCSVLGLSAPQVRLSHQLQVASEQWTGV